MSLPLAFLWVAEGIMTAALICFLRAFALRKTDQRKHMFWGKTGAYMVFAGLVAVEIVIRGVGWEFPKRSETAFFWHLVTALASTALLILLLITGIYRIRAIHVRLYLLFLPLYTATVALSWFAFRMW